MRLTAPEMARALPRRACCPRAPTCSTPGQVGTEMLYFLVGSRDLDGGLMCTASHNPKAYTGAKLVRDGALALSGDSRHPARPRARARPMRRPPRRAAAARRSTSTRTSTAAALRFIDPQLVRGHEPR